MHLQSIGSQLVDQSGKHVAALISSIRIVIEDIWYCRYNQCAFTEYRGESEFILLYNFEILYCDRLLEMSCNIHVIRNQFLRKDLAASQQSFCIWDRWRGKSRLIDFGSIYCQGSIACICMFYESIELFALNIARMRGLRVCFIKRIKCHSNIKKQILLIRYSIILDLIVLRKISHISDYL